MKRLETVGEKLHHFQFHIFHRKRNDIIGNVNGIGITVILKMKIYD
jgi:hypothetical protein